MKKININILIISIILIIAIGIIGINVYQHSNKDEIVDISGVDFSLNSIKTEFLKTSYANDNKCRVKVLEKGFNIKCKKEEYNYTFDGIELSIKTDKNGLEVFKYLVNSIEILHGYQENDFLNTLELFINGKIDVTSLSYKIVNNDVLLSVNVIQKLEMVKELDNISGTIIKDIMDTDYEYTYNNYKISGIDMKSDEDDLLYIFSATLSGDDFNRKFTITFYDINNSVVSSKTVNLGDYNSYDKPVLNFVVTTNMSEEDFKKVSKYSINLS